MKILSNLFLLTILFFSQTLGFEINFEDVKTIDELLQIYGEKYRNQSLSDEALIRKATEDWVALVQSEYKGVEPLDTLPAHIVEAEGVQYYLYGFTHGESYSLVLSAKGHYLRFVLNAFEKEQSQGGYILTEDTMNTLFLSSYNKLIDVKDRDLLKCRGSGPEVNAFVYAFIVNIFTLGMGIFEAVNAYTLALTLPVLAVPSGFDFWEYLNLATGKIDGNYYGLIELYTYNLFNKTADSLDIEIQQALGGKLPTHLESQLLLKKVNSNAPLANKDERSAYMAGFLKGFAKSGNLKRVPFFAGLYHVPDIKGFLLDTSKVLQENEFFKIGLETGSLLATEISQIDEENPEALEGVLAPWRTDSSEILLREYIYNYSILSVALIPPFFVFAWHAVNN